MDVIVVDRPPSAPQHLRYSFVITNTNITVQLFWQPPTSGDVTGYQVTCAKAGANWYTDRRTLVTATLPSVRALSKTLFSDTSSVSGTTAVPNTEIFQSLWRHMSLKNRLDLTYASAICRYSIHALPSANLLPSV